MGTEELRKLHDDAHQRIWERMEDVRAAVAKLEKVIGQHNKAFAPDEIDPDQVMLMLGWVRIPF